MTKYCIIADVRETKEFKKLTEEFKLIDREDYASIVTQIEKIETLRYEHMKYVKHINEIFTNGNVKIEEAIIRIELTNALAATKCAVLFIFLEDKPDKTFEHYLKSFDCGAILQSTRTKEILINYNL